MPTVPKDLELFDAHVHSFSHRFFEALAEPLVKRGDLPAEGAVDLIGKRLKIEIPPPDPKTLADRWVVEMDRHGVQRVVLLTSVVGDEETTAALCRTHPDRFVGYVMIDPTKPDAETRARRALTELGLKGMMLFPAMHGFHAWEERVRPIYQVAAEVGAVAFVHFGLLRVAIRDRLGLPSPFDLRFSNPLDLSGPAMAFPQLRFIIPHFGCGFFREALLVGKQCDNVYLDTSSSNNWVEMMPYPLDLQGLFARTLGVLGPERILFGTDSTVFPRGWRSEVFTAQRAALETLGVSRADQAKIFSGNLTRLLGPWGSRGTGDLR
ncbi:MAG: amidohydrolase family protein [Candidatus Methylomirabilales bacterium]